MAEPALGVAGLVKSFGALKATDGVDLQLNAGEIHALIGPNGAGKSTLIGQIAGTLRPDRGEIRLYGRDVTHLDASGRSRLGVARTFQVSSLVDEFSALRNVMLAVQGRSRTSYRFIRNVMNDRTLVDPAREALDRVGLSKRADVPASELSHGERRQLEIAVALALGPKVFLLDEPMAGMGPDGSRALTGFLHRLREEAPILLVEHDMDAVFALADRVSVLVYGRVVASGTVDEIRNDPVVREAYLGEPAA
ncbi:MAG: ABC transporter ATP-binding protein [Hyphomicrobiales bacterium]|nr:ABC transporter ATP-binding protein [Hyphomicrobiales bacterium]